MTELSQDQAALKSKIRTSAFIWADILGLIAGGITYLATSSMETTMRVGLAIIVFAVVAGLIFMWRYKANSASATCPNCSATFSITRTDRAENTLSSEPKETRDAQPDHSTKVTTWIEDKIEVTDTYTCAKCANATTKQYTRTVKRDEKEAIEPAPVKDKPTPKAEPEPGVATSTKSAPADDDGGFFSAAKEATTPSKGSSKK